MRACACDFTPGCPMLAGEAAAWSCAGEPPPSSRVRVSPIEDGTSCRDAAALARRSMCC